MGVQIRTGNNSTGLANVSSNYDLNVNTPTDASIAGFVNISSEVDDGTVLGERTTLPAEVSDDYRLRVGLDQTLFNLSFEGTNIPQGHLLQQNTTMAVAQANGFLTVNSTTSTTSGQAAYVRTYRSFPTFGTYPTYCDIWGREANYAATNAQSEWGFLYFASAAQAAVQTPTAGNIDGIFFRRLSGGVLRAVVNNNAVETTVDIVTANIPSRDGVGSYDPTEVNHYLIVFHNDVVRFWINDVLVASIDVPGSLQFPTASSNIPVGVRVVNFGIASAGRQFGVGFINVGQGDQNSSKPWSHAMCGSGQGSYQTQQGSASGPTVTRAAAGAQGWPTSGTARAAGTYTATSAPSLNSLGGLFTIAANTATDTDYPIFNFVNPAGTPTLPGKTLYITGLRVGEAFMTAAPTTNPAFVSFIVTAGGYNNAGAVATSTTDGANTVAPRGIVVGGHGFLTTDAVGTVKPGFEVTFNSPLVIPAGTAFLFVMRPFSVSATTTLTFHSSLAVNGYFE